MKRLLLMGGGHAHLAVLEALARTPIAGLETTLVTPSPYQTYSGMLPGWLAGYYALDDCRIDLRPLVTAAKVRLVLDQTTGLDADGQQAFTAVGQTYPYDLASLDIGSDSALEGLLACAERLLPIRPLDGFLQAWTDILQTAQQEKDYTLAVVGGGAAGVELALAIQYAFQQSTPANPTASVHLVTPSLLAGHATGVVKRVKQQLADSGIQLHLSRAHGDPLGLQLQNGTHLPAHCILAATGAKAAPWLASSGLAIDGQGYIQVNNQHQSVSHANVFAAGDVCSRSHPHFSRSGVHAVYAGKALAHNLPAFLNGETLRSYMPKPRSLYLLATGSKHAIASWGEWSAAGHWVWRWKDYIDRGFIQKYRRPLGAQR